MRESSKMAGRVRRSPVLVVLVILACGFFGVLFGRTDDVTAKSDTDMRDSARSFSQVYSVIEQNYAQKVDADKAIYDGAIPGMLRVLDPHSNFFDPKQFRRCTKSSAAATTASACRSVRAITR